MLPLPLKTSFLWATEPFVGVDCSVVNYRFSYQNSEQDIELYGVSGAFTTYFRELDVRVCRWFSLDPKTAATPWESPYVSMGNNPIFFNDIIGDKVKGQTQKEQDLYTNHKKLTSEKLISLQGILLNTKSKRGQRLIKDQINALNKALNELDQMEKSDVTYNIRIGDRITNVTGQGNTIYNINTNEVDINIVTENGNFNVNQILAHELKHGFQYDSYRLIFGWDGISNNNCKQFEKEAFSRSNLYANSPEQVVQVYDKINYDPNYNLLPEGPRHTLTNRQLNRNNWEAGAFYRISGIGKPIINQYYKNYELDVIDGIMNRPKMKFMDPIKFKLLL